MIHNDPRLTSVYDQAAAAARDAARAVASAVAMDGGPITVYDRVGPFGRKCLTAIAGLWTSKRGDAFCPHIKPQAPVPAFWFAWKPGRIRCAQCVDRLPRLSRQENFTCDRCRRRAVRIRPLTIPIPPQVTTFEDGSPPISFPPLVVQYGLCPACADREYKGARPLHRIDPRPRASSGT